MFFSKYITKVASFQLMGTKVYRIDGSANDTLSPPCEGEVNNESYQTGYH
jgi:hypothetical protein